MANQHENTLKFAELYGGQVISVFDGRIILRVCVEDLTVDESARVVRSVLAGLEAEFADK